jgi:hypothetical protein
LASETGHPSVHPASISAEANECYEVDYRTGAGDQLICLLQEHRRLTGLKTQLRQSIGENGKAQATKNERRKSKQRIGAP